MKKQNNGLVRNPFLYLLIIFFLVTGFQYFYSGNTAGRSEKINYTELVKEIKVIEEALLDLPEEYRSGVWNNILFGSPYPIDADRTTYGRYKSFNS